MTEQKPPRRRLSLTKRQRQTDAGAELLALCETVSADGSLEDAEIAALRDWTVRHESADLPAKAYLHHVIGAILVDGRITAVERDQLYDALEAVLPPEVRAVIQGRRARTIVASPATTGDQRQAGRATSVLDFMVAGVRYEGRAEIIRRHVRGGDRVYLRRDPQNRFSRSAVEVRIAQGHQIGYVPEADAIGLAPLLDSGHLHVARVKKILSGGQAPIPVVVAEVLPPDTTRPDAVRNEDVRVTDAGSPTEAKQGQTGCGVALALLVVLMIWFVIIA